MSANLLILLLLGITLLASLYSLLTWLKIWQRLGHLVSRLGERHR